jgi:hypothetical protein
MQKDHDAGCRVSGNYQRWRTRPGHEVQLLATGDYRVLTSGKTNAADEYAFKVPDGGYHILATGDKAHVTNMASVDIW